MLSVNKLGSAHHAEAYYDDDDYYSEKGQGPSRWAGKGAVRLGLTGEVERDQLGAMLRGAMPGGQQMGKKGDGSDHAPGHDATFSAPKSVSIAALVGGDKRLLEAHEAATAVAISYLEEKTAEVRIREADSGIRVENTGNLIVAAFDHATSRDQDPQLHTHCLIMNASLDENGQARSILTRGLYENKFFANEVYQQELASHARKLGYSIVETKNGFELGEVSQGSIDAFSSRRKAVDAWLKEHGYDRESASSEIRERAALATRPTKQHEDRQTLAERWKELSASVGFDAEKSVREVAMNAPDDTGGSDEDADAALASASLSLSERASRFTLADLENVAMREARATRATLSDVRDAIKRSEERGELRTRIVETERGEQCGFTTDNAIRIEAAYLAIEEVGRDKAGAVMHSAQAEEMVREKEQSSEFPWTRGQREATVGLLASTDRISAVQGFAGTAKTTTVIKTVAEAARADGCTVRGLAPTRSAAEQLGEGGGIAETVTVKGFLLSQQREEQSEGRQLWVVDEASMLSAKDTRDLLRAAEQREARVVLVGDVKQLGSVEAGEAFKQLQNNGMSTFVLDDIVRQRNTDAKTAVEASIDGDVQRAMQSVERSGFVQEVRDGESRRNQIASDYLALDAEGRKSALVLDQTRAGRSALNERIRDGLRQEGSITGYEIKATALEKKDLTNEESKQASRYEEGDIVKFAKGNAQGGKEGIYYTVSKIDYASKTVHLKDDENNAVSWEPRRGGTKMLEVYQPGKAGVAVGDQLQWTRNAKDRGLTNGLRLTVTSVDGHTVSASDARGGTFSLDLSQRDDQHFRHAYATTVHAAQGRTTGVVMANLSAGEAKKLLDQRSYYTAISRAKDRIHLYTDDRKAVEGLISERSGEKQTAIESVKEREHNEALTADRERELLQTEREEKKLSALKARDSERAAERSRCQDQGGGLALGD